VSVVLKGTTIGTASDVSGNYNLRVPEGQEDGALIFSAVGYLTQESVIGNQAVIDVVLKLDVKALNELGIESFDGALARR
jgi:TonB-dependent starch-binding outer membrane protein SusC